MGFPGARLASAVYFVPPLSLKLEFLILYFVWLYLPLLNFFFVLPNPAYLFVGCQG